MYFYQIKKRKRWLKRVERRKKAKKERDFTDFHESVHIRNRRKRDPSKLN